MFKGNLPAVFTANKGLALTKKEEEIFALTRPTVAHVKPKIVPLEHIKRAIQNKPFEEMWSIAHLVHEETDKEERLVQVVEQVLEQHYAPLRSHNILFSIRMTDAEQSKEQEAMTEAIKYLRTTGLNGISASLQKMYEEFCTVRAALTYLLREKLLTEETLIPAKHIVDLAVACPVWFRNGSSYTRRDFNPFPNVIDTRELSWFLQLYNQENNGWGTRTFHDFGGVDILPKAISDRIVMIKRAFPALIIATPYLDIPARAWAAPPIPRNIDPYLMGFIPNFPFMFLVARWSGTGLFPLMTDMVADTMEHLRRNMHLLKNFGRDSMWTHGVRSGEWGSPILQRRGITRGNTILPQFAKEILRAYDNGKVFAFLRGELGPNTTTPKSLWQQTL